MRGSRTVSLHVDANDGRATDAKYTATIRHLDISTLAVCTATDTTLTPNTSTSGITSGGNDVKLTVQAGGLAINQAVSTGAGDLTLNVVGAVTQTATGDRKSVV